MKKEAIYKEALKAGAYERKSWVLKAFSVCRPMPDELPTPFDFRYNRTGTEVYYPQGEGYQWIPVDDAVPMSPVYYPADPISVKVGDIPNAKEDIPDTTYGDLLFNYFLLVYSFNDIIEYVVGPTKIGDIERNIARRIVDDVEVAGVEPRPGEIAVNRYMLYGKAAGALAGFTQLFTPSITRKSLSTHPNSKPTRARLLEENKDRLHDPAVVASIQNVLIDLDKEHIAGDASEGFFLNSNKTFGTARKRMFGIHGPEAGFKEGSDAELVVNSLEEGWDITKLPAMYNSLRAGSYFRGALTALGGEAVKFFLRVFQNVVISEDDCKTTILKNRYIDPNKLNYYEGLYQVTPSGDLITLTPDKLKALAGKTILSRSPQYCTTGHTDYCKVCCGLRLSENIYSVPSQASAVGSMFMDIMMASAHAKELKTARLDIRTAFR